MDIMLSINGLLLAVTAEGTSGYRLQWGNRVEVIEPSSPKDMTPRNT